MSEPNEQTNGACSWPEQDAIDQWWKAHSHELKEAVTAYRLKIQTSTIAPAQSREEEAKPSASGCGYWNGIECMVDADSITAREALRSRQSPQAEDDRAIDLLGEIMSYDNYRAFPPNLRERIDEFMADAEMEGMQSCGPDGPEGHDAIPAAPQPSTQGEDALAEMRNTAKQNAITADQWKRKAEALEVSLASADREHTYAAQCAREKIQELEDRLASAQSSAQGEEAREMREALDKGIWAWDQMMPPAPEHICGPDAGCDGACAEFAAWTEGRGIILKARAALERKESSYAGKR